MMIIRQIVLFGSLLSVLVTWTAVAEDITTTDGRTYYAVTVISNRCDALGIIISHRTGIARIDFNEMNTDNRRRFGYDPEKAAATVAEQKSRADKAKKAAESTKMAVANAQTAREKEKSFVEATQEKAAKDHERQIWSEALWTFDEIKAAKDAQAKFKTNVADPRVREFVEESGARADADICKKFGITQKQLDAIVDKGNQENWPRDRPAAQIAAIVSEAGPKPENSAWDGSVAAVKAYLKDNLRDPIY